MRVLTYKKTAKKRSRTRHGINAERVKMRMSKGDTVRVMRGEDRGKEGKVLRTFPKTGRVLVEADVRAVLPARLLGSPHDNGSRHLGLFHGPVGQRVLHGDDDNVAEARVAPAGSAEHADDQRRLGARIVRDFYHRFLLDHWKS